MWIKICANTTLEDALAAAEFGADAAGFVFAPSRRQVTPQQVAAISAGLPPELERVGVFPAASADEIAAAVFVARLHAVQLHGGYDALLTERLRVLLPASVSIIQTVPWLLGDATAGADIPARITAIRHSAAAADGRVLVDTSIATGAGGTGIPFDWQRAAPILAGIDRLIVAGGLRPDNVAQAIRTLHPWGVDVASGVESVPGRKDRVKLRAFIKDARGV